jgi:glycosyltransferase involved in cell wall biosynthesis
VALAGAYESALSLRWAGVSPRTPTIFLFHGAFYSEWGQALGGGRPSLARRLLRGYMDVLERLVFLRSARIVAVSHFSAAYVTARAPSAASRVRVVPTGVDTTYFQPAPDRAAARAAIGHTEDVPLLLGVGRLAGVKQMDRLVTGFALARQGGLRAKLVLAGDGPERPRIERLVQERGVGADVTLAGYCDPPRLRALMQAADLQVCSSAFENFSLAILEAYACATPVLSTPGGGLPEQVGAVDPALVLADDRPETLAAGMARLAPRTDDLRRLGARARTLATDHYDWERIVDQLEDVCNEVWRA